MKVPPQDFGRLVLGHCSNVNKPALRLNDIFDFRTHGSWTHIVCDPDEGRFVDDFGM